MNRKQVIPYISFYVDDALSDEKFDIDENTRLVGFQCGFEPLYVAVKSYLPNIKLSSCEAEEIAIDLLAEKKWFSNGPINADYIF
jgi:hypothetical protein